MVAELYIIIMIYFSSYLLLFCISQYWYHISSHNQNCISQLWYQIFLTLFSHFFKIRCSACETILFLLSFVVRRLYYSVLVVRQPRSYSFALHSTIPNAFGCDTVLQHPVLIGNIPFIPLLHPFRIPYSTGN